MAKFSCMWWGGGSQPSQPPRKKLKVCNDRETTKGNCICGLSGGVCLCVYICVCFSDFFELLLC